MDIGARLQLVRKSKGLSQRELAKRVGVTNSTISLIEQNKVSPSVSSLKKVLDGIPISLADFFTLDLEKGLPDSPFYVADELPEGQVHSDALDVSRRVKRLNARVDVIEQRLKVRGLVLVEAHVRTSNPRRSSIAKSSVSTRPCVVR